MRKNLSIVLLYHPTSEVRGKLRRYFYEVKANVFVGTVSAGVRDTLWEELTKTSTEASMIVHVSSEQGFEYRTTKQDPSYTFKDFYGITLPTTFKNDLTLNDLYAKPDYRLMDHLLDVGYIAQGLMTYGRAYSMVEALSKNLDVDRQELVSSISWLCALHDIGKAHPAFIGKMYQNSTNEGLIELFESLKDKNLVRDGNFTGFRHERFSRDILKKWFSQNNYPIQANYFADLIAYHHQGKDDHDFSTKITLQDLNWLMIHDEIIDEIEKHWQFSRHVVEHAKNWNGLLYSILSIMVTADWIASGSQWRQVLQHCYDEKELAATKFIHENMLAYEPLDILLKNKNWNDVFEFNPNTLQTTIIDASKNKPNIMIVEYPCGGGKTEAALAAAKLIGKDKSGIYIATPTMSTAKTMTQRMNDVAKNAGLTINIPEFDSSTIWSDEDMLKIPKELWVSKSRHKMLYPFAVGTVDQILKTMLYYRYACIGLLGLSDKVIIIDEVHAYDSYMLTEIKCLIKWCAYLNIPLILLSATLPTVTKKDLLVAAGCKKDELNLSKNYPLITCCKNKSISEYPVLGENRKFGINIIETDDYRNYWHTVIDEPMDGCTAYIQDTIDNTWDLFLYAKQKNSTVEMFQGRDTIKHKEEKALRLVSRLGKNRLNRPSNYKLVATSIIEQSLDVDFDRMYTCLAPVDLLIQRIGRVWRHSDEGTIRENKIIEKPITIIIPKSISELPNIYSQDILLRTCKVIKSLTEINTVLDARQLIDNVYENIKLINKPTEIMSAGFNTIDSPTYDSMFDCNNTSYNRFRQISNATRFETIPSVLIGIVTPDDLVDLETNYLQMRKIHQENIVGMSLYKIQKLKLRPITFSHKMLSDINFYYVNDLQQKGIELTEDGLKWSNN